MSSKATLIEITRQLSFLSVVTMFAMLYQKYHRNYQVLVLFVKQMYCFLITILLQDVKNPRAHIHSHRRTMQNKTKCREYCRRDARSHAKRISPKSGFANARETSSTRNAPSPPHQIMSITRVGGMSSVCIHERRRERMFGDLSSK
jgi:hypothetical protein